MLGVQLRDHVGLVSFERGTLVLKPLKPVGAEFARDLAAAAKEATGIVWEVRLTDEGGAPSLHQQETMAEEQMRAAVLEEPNVKALLAEFPDATLETVDRREA
jgi:DNA polymerase-3 subunit gamma/tau